MTVHHDKETVKIGVIGAGWWATANHIPELQKRSDVELVAVCRLGKDLLHQIKDKFGFQFAAEDYHELLEQDVDAVIVSSPHYLHYEHAKAAIQCGKHVLIEKPMTLNPAEAWELVELAKQQKTHLMIPYGWHYKPYMQTAKRLIHEVGIGEIEYAMCHMASPTRVFFAGRGGTEEMPAEWKSLSEPEPSTWQVKANGGGYAHGQITHSAGMLFWLTNLRAKEVTARMTAPNSAVDLYDAATVLFDNGAIGTVSGAATIPGGQDYQVDIRLFGREGVLFIDVERERAELYRHDGNHRTLNIPEGEGEYSCEGPPNRFIEVIRGRGINDSSGEVGARAVELIDAMFRSAEAGSQPTAVYRS